MTAGIVLRGRELGEHDKARPAIFHPAFFGLFKACRRFFAVADRHKSVWVDALSQKKIASGLRPEILDEMGLVAAIDWQAKDFQKRTGIRTRVALPPEGIKLDLERSTTTFRIFQEILTNVARHAHASRVDVRFDVTDAYMTLEVADNGVGIPEAKLNGKSLGLLGIQERALHFNGDVAISGAAGQGTKVTVSIPLAGAR